MASAFDDWLDESHDDEVGAALRADLKAAFAAGVRSAAEWTAIYLKEEVPYER
jgi:hypothetical protein